MAKESDRNDSNLTIVGGRPQSRRTGGDTPDGVQQVLVLAASDEAFRERLLADREAALGGCGIDLNATARAVLMAAPADQLEAMVQRLVPEDPQRREFLRQAARTGGAIAAAALLAGTGCSDDEDVRTKGIRPDPPHHDNMKPTGIRPDRPEPKTPPPPEETPAGPDDSSKASGGIRPDKPPRILGIRPGGKTRGIRPDRPVKKSKD